MASKKYIRLIPALDYGPLVAPPLWRPPPERRALRPGAEEMLAGLRRLHALAGEDDDKADVVRRAPAKRRGKQVICSFSKTLF